MDELEAVLNGGSHMKIEVILQDKGSITIEQKRSLDAHSIKKMVTHCVDLLKDTDKRNRIGFD